jgi:transcriptional regulator with XRE-family HTH domain
VSGANERIGRAVMVLRAERRMKRTDLAERSGVPYSFLTSIETGARGMSHTTMVAVAETFGLMPSDLLSRAESLPALN